MAMRPVLLSALPNFQKFPRQTLVELPRASYSRTKYTWVYMDCKQPACIRKSGRHLGYNIPAPTQHHAGMVCAVTPLKGGSWDMCETLTSTAVLYTMEMCIQRIQGSHKNNAFCQSADTLCRCSLIPPKLYCRLALLH
jgi:hypothetical protein